MKFFNINIFFALLISSVCLVVVGQVTEADKQQILNVYNSLGKGGLFAQRAAIFGDFLYTWKQYACVKSSKTGTGPVCFRIEGSTVQELGQSTAQSTYDQLVKSYTEGTLFGNK